MDPLLKTPTGIVGFDEVLFGGLPQGRPTLVFGGPGCGKTALALEFICRGARQYKEPGLFVSFDESVQGIKRNFASCSFGFAEALEDRSVRIESFQMSGDYTVVLGDFSLDGLIARLEHALEASKARRLVLDGLNAMLSQFPDTANLRHELSRFFQWTKQKGLTTIITNEQEGRHPIRFALEEYVSDCVVHLDHRIREQISKRRLRIIKFRGSSHGTDEYPFLITDKGIFLFPITRVGLDSAAPEDFLSSGIDGLDDMLAGHGYYRGSTLLITGCAGTGKSTLAMTLALSACRNGGRSLYFAFEESASQIKRNMRSVGIEVENYVQKGLLRIHPVRPSSFGLEEHLVVMLSVVDDFKPDAVIVDPITSFTSIGDKIEVRALFTRTLDYLKDKGITTLMTNLTKGSGTDEESETAVSSIVDAWVIIHFQCRDGHRRRQIYIHKARGIAHSPDTGELLFSSAGVVVKPFYR